MSLARPSSGMSLARSSSVMLRPMSGMASSQFDLAKVKSSSSLPALNNGMKRPNSYMSMRPGTPHAERTVNLVLEGSVDENHSSDINEKEISIAKEEVYDDPELAIRGFIKRPMVLTHSIMIGLTLIILIVVESLLVGTVSSISTLS